jgi:hypothetical protein
MDRHTPLDSPRCPESEARKGPAYDDFYAIEQVCNSRPPTPQQGTKTTSSSSQLPNGCAQVLSSNCGSIFCSCYGFDVLLGKDHYIAVTQNDAHLLYPLDDLQRKTYSHSTTDMETLCAHIYNA